MKEPEDGVFAAARNFDTGVVIMNAGRNDKLFKGPDAPAPEQFYRYVLSHPAVALTIMGLRDVPRFVHVAAALAARADLDGDEKAALETYGAARRAAGAL